MPVDKGDDNDAHEEIELKLSRESEKARVRRLAVAWENVLATEQGRAVLFDIIALTGKDESPARQTTDQTLMQVGRGDFGRWLYGNIKEEYPRRFIQMITENLK